ncbi:MAG: hypothetical protein ACK51T_12590, partial [bacterium]
MPTGDVPSPAHRTSPAERLLKKARTRFPGLNAAEELMVIAAAEGEWAVVGAAMAPQPEGEGDSKRWHPASRWSMNIRAEREQWTISADVLHWLCTNPAAIKLVHAKGVQIEGAVITGELDFQSAHIPVPLLLAACDILEPISAINAHFAFLVLRGCAGKGLTADRARFDKGTLLRHGTCMTGEVRLLGATIGGDLDCIGGRFENPSGVALNAYGLRVRGSVTLREGFHATGGVSFRSATIGGDLDCVGGWFENRNREAINVQSANIAGNLLLRDGFKAQGNVVLRLATIGGLLNMHGWRCDDVNNPQQDDTFIHGILNLSHCRIGTLADGKGTIDCLKNSKTTLLLHGFSYSNIYQGAPTDAESRLTWLRLHPEQDFTPQPYGQLARVLDSLGHADDARKIRVAAAGDAANNQLLQSLFKDEDKDKV